MRTLDSVSRFSFSFSWIRMVDKRADEHAERTREMRTTAGGSANSCGR